MDLNAIIRDAVREELFKIPPTLPTQQADPDQLMTTDEVCELTSLPKPFFECGRSQGSTDLPPHYRIGRRVMYRRGDVIDWLQKRREVVGDE